MTEPLAQGRRGSGVLLSQVAMFNLSQFTCWVCLSGARSWVSKHFSGLFPCRKAEEGGEDTSGAGKGQEKAGWRDH